LKEYDGDGDGRILPKELEEGKKNFAQDLIKN